MDSKTMWQAKAPSNIAITKYMGKKDSSVNSAINPSLSMTLSNFTSEVKIELSKKINSDIWLPFDGANRNEISVKAQARFLSFFRNLKEKQGVQENFIIRSRNNFPSDCGLASSASSFAALTMAANSCFAEIWDRPLASSMEELAKISRSGSGSSCRSFFSPWCAWEGEKIFPVKNNLPALSDVVVILSNQPKKISSSEAHHRVMHSPLMVGREERVTKRQNDAKLALENSNFRALAEIAWAETWEMHSMFHTATPPFFYFEPNSIFILRWVESLWEEKGWGPIATVDAGPNVHLLIPTSEKAKLIYELEKILPKQIQFLESI